MKRKRTKKSGNLLEHIGLKTFKQHGFIPESTSGGTQVLGNCVFCGGDRFFVNPETKQWDCKHCTRNGGFNVWLDKVVEYCKENTSRKLLRELAKERSIAIGTLSHFDVCYNPHTKRYIIPIYDMNKEKVWDIRIYTNKGIMSTSGCNSGLLGWDQFSGTQYKNVWLCEGEWDGMVMHEILTDKGMLGEHITVAVPGANTFKSDWSIYFKDKVVVTIYDNDHDKIVKGVTRNGAGITGAIKVFNTIRSSVRDIKFVHWPHNYKDGFDLRDFYKQHSRDADKTMRGLSHFYNPLPKAIELDKDDDPNISLKERFDGAGIDIEDVHKVYSRWLHLKDTRVIDILFASVIANRLEGDPIWMFIVARSGGAKSVFIRSIEDCPAIVTTTSLTPQSLISGHSGDGNGDPSLIPKLKDKVLAIKDFTTILNLNPTTRDEIFGILRDAYDGKTEKIFGTGKVASYDSMFGLIAGVTPAIELFTEGHTALGERFLRYVIPHEEDLFLERELLRRALKNTTYEDKMNAELKEVAGQLLNYDYSSIKPSASGAIQEKIISLAQFVSVLRGTINRDKYTKEVTHKPFTELATRISKQLYKLMMAIGQLHRVEDLNEVQLDMIKSVALSTVPTRMEETIKQLYQADSSIVRTTSDVVDMIKLPRLTTARVLENLSMLGAVERTKLDTVSVVGDRNGWVLSKNIVNLIEETGLYERKGYVTKTEKEKSSIEKGSGSSEGRDRRSRTPKRYKKAGRQRKRK